MTKKQTKRLKPAVQELMPTRRELQKWGFKSLQAQRRVTREAYKYFEAKTRQKPESTITKAEREKAHNDFLQVMVTRWKYYVVSRRKGKFFGDGQPVPKQPHWLKILQRNSGVTPETMETPLLGWNSKYYQQGREVNHETIHHEVKQHYLELLDKLAKGKKPPSDIDKWKQAIQSIAVHRTTVNYHDGELRYSFALRDTYDNKVPANKVITGSPTISPLPGKNYPSDFSSRRLSPLPIVKRFVATLINKTRAQNE